MKTPNFTITDVVSCGVSDPISFFHGSAITHLLRFESSKSLDDLEAVVVAIGKIKEHLIEQSNQQQPGAMNPMNQMVR